jgi:hypothetical protein
VTHGNTLATFEKAGITPVKYDPVLDYCYNVGEGSYTFILKETIKITQDAFSIEENSNG